jgi:ATP-binding cassette subfamily F protein uup
VAVVGPNGAGKTTLVKVLLGDLAADAGEIKLGHQPGDRLHRPGPRGPVAGDDPARRADAAGRRPGAGARHAQARHGYAKDFLFKESQLRQPVKSLSGGERNRLLLARALATPANVLVLDEPTNDLDMDTLDLLEDLLADYEGTLILVSHDRDFIDRLATSTIGLDGTGRAVETPGGWQDFLAQNPGFFGARYAAAQSTSKKAPSAPPPPPAKAVAKLSYKDQRRLEELEREIAELPGKIATIETGLNDANLYAKDPAGFDRLSKALDAARAKLSACEEEWLALEERREALAN